MVVSCENGKYVWEFNESTGKLTCKRNGEEWRNETGDGAILSLLHEIDNLKDRLSEVHSWAVCSCITTADDMMNNIERIVEITEL